jgi:hypothetical protein
MSLKRIDWQALQGKQEEASKPVQLEFSFEWRVGSFE